MSMRTKLSFLKWTIVMTWISIIIMIIYNNNLILKKESLILMSNAKIIQDKVLSGQRHRSSGRNDNCSSSPDPIYSKWMSVGRKLKRMTTTWLSQHRIKDILLKHKIILGPSCLICFNHILWVDPSNYGLYMFFVRI